MDGMPLRRFARSIFIPAAILALTACGQVNSAKNSVNGANPSGGGGTGSTVPIPSGPVVNSAGFFVDVTGTQHTDLVKFMHQADAAYGADVGTTNFSSSCKIAEGSAAGGDILCVAEVNELDLYFDNINIQYHVPSDMCSYFTVKPYWFYVFAPGTGPLVATSTVAADGTITDVANTVNGVPTCSYDYTANSGPNCCAGLYTHTVTTFSSTGSSVAVTKESWGGKAGNCVAGVGSQFTRELLTGIPMTTVQYVNGTGVNESIVGTSPLNSTFNSFLMASNVWTANFYKPSQHTGGMPISMQQPAGITSGSTFYLPADTYEFRCLDTAQEIKQRIRLFIREWNEEGQLAEGGDPDTTGTEPNFPTFPINDRSDWFDFGNNYPAGML